MVNNPEIILYLKGRFAGMKDVTLEWLKLGVNKAGAGLQSGDSKKQLFLPSAVAFPGSAPQTAPSAASLSLVCPERACAIIIIALLSIFTSFEAVTHPCACGIDLHCALDDNAGTFLTE